MTQEELLKDFPDLTAEDIRACLAFAADRERKLSGAAGMKLLFDQNLSSRLTRLLGDLYPESIHVREVGLREAEDTAIWEYAKQNGFIVISKDSDFQSAQLSVWQSTKIYLAARRQLQRAVYRRASAEIFCYNSHLRHRSRKSPFNAALKTIRYGDRLRFHQIQRLDPNLKVHSES